MTVETLLFVEIFNSLAFNELISRIKKTVEFGNEDICKAKVGLQTVETDDNTYQRH